MQLVKKNVEKLNNNCKHKNNNIIKIINKFSKNS